jgi:RHS repeat-associated protein
MPIAAEINGRLYAIHTDHLNTPRRLTSQQGQVAWQWLISGFGEVRPTMGARGYGQTVSGPSYAQAVKFDLRYPGQVFDEETGLSYNLHRYYDAATGRYIQADPIGLEGGWNRFGYVANNPLNDVDPQGLHPVLGRIQGLYYRYGPAITEFIAGASGVNGAVASPAVISPLVAQIPTGVSRMAPIARGIAEGVESGAFCSSVDASNVANIPRLARQLTNESARSPFLPNGALTKEALARSRAMPNLGPGQLSNPAIPAGYGKYTTETFQSLAGDYQMHFYMNPGTGEVFYGLDYKAIFNNYSGALK